MLAMLDYLDGAILLPYTKVSHLVQRLLRRTNYTLAAWSAHLLVVDVVLHYIFLTKPADRMPWWWMCFLSICWWAMSRRALRAESKFWANPGTIPVQDGAARSDQILRLLVAFLGLPVYGRWLIAHGQLGLDVYSNLFGGVAVTSFYYFMAVIPQPPSRARERVRGTLIPQVMEG